MDKLLHPITWCFVFCIGIFYILDYFMKKEGMLRKISIMEIIILLVYAIDIKSSQYFVSNYYIREYFGRIIVFSIFCTWYLEDYINYKNSDKGRQAKQKVMEISGKYLFIITFYVFYILYIEVLRDLILKCSVIEACSLL